MSGITDLLVWREAAELAVRVEATAKRLLRVMGRSAADQMIRAANSISANIAEGYGRGVNRDGLRLLNIAHASTDELENHLRVFVMKQPREKLAIGELIGHTRRVGFLLRRFEQSVERRMKDR
jgi:four helix bundle protein